MSYPAWQRGMVFIFLVRHALELHVTMQWKNYCPKALKLNIRLLHRYLLKDREIIGQSQTFQSLPEKCRVKRKLRQSSSDCSSPAKVTKNFDVQPDRDTTTDDDDPEIPTQVIDDPETLTQVIYVCNLNMLLFFSYLYILVYQMWHYVIPNMGSENPIYYSFTPLCGFPNVNHKCDVPNLVFQYPNVNTNLVFQYLNVETIFDILVP